MSKFPTDIHIDGIACVMGQEGSAAQIAEKLSLQIDCDGNTPKHSLDLDGPNLP